MRFYIVEETQESCSGWPGMTGTVFVTSNEVRALGKLKDKAKVYCFDVKEVTEMNVNVEVKTSE